MGERLFDELARALAEPLPRRRALRLLGAAVLGAWVASPRAPARASTQGHVCDGRVRDEKWKYCTNASESCFPTCCPQERICCVGPLGGNAQCPTLVSCCNPCNPNGSRCLPDGSCGPGPIAATCNPCDQPGAVDCGRTCCVSGEFCAFDEIGKCCPNDHAPCAAGSSKRCCPPDRECCAFAPLPGQRGTAATACCDRRTERCLSLKGRCCPKERACGAKECCEPNEVCDEREQTCSCPRKQKRCGGRCCPPDAVCDRTGKRCVCPGGRQMCGSGTQCCPKGKVCPDENGRCCAPRKVCGASCCDDPLFECVDGTTCVKRCLRGASRCGLTCCADATERCESGTCVPLG